jgi:hypothetical protein
MVLRILLVVSLLIPALAHSEPITIILTAIGIGSVATYETTGKGVSDHIVSGIKDQDCKTARAFSNEPVCQDKVANDDKKPPVPDNPVPKPKKVVVESSTIDSYEKVLAQRKGAR